jgi:nucleotide-binding universal stress UspA family protein
MHAGPILIGFDGSPAAEDAIRDAGELLRGRRALVVTIHQRGLGFELMELPAASQGMPPVVLDIRTALEVDRELMERAQNLARRGADHARAAGFDAEPLAVADDPDVRVSETLVNLARERDAAAIVLGEHLHGTIEKVILGRTARDVIRTAPCPAIIVRGEESGERRLERERAEHGEPAHR